MINEELEQWLDAEAEVAVYRMYTKCGFQLRMKYARWYYFHFGDRLKKRKDSKGYWRDNHWTQILLNPLVLWIIDITDGISYLKEILK